MLSIAGTGGAAALGNETDAVTSEQVRIAIERAGRYLVRHQKADGSWTEREVYDGGLTPLCTLALLQSGYTPADEPVRKALEYLEKLTPTSTYTASLQTMVFCKADAPRFIVPILRNVKWLEGSQVKSGKDAGMWAIPAATSTDHTDNSMTHMAMLALWEADRVGAHASDETWRRALEAWQRSQNPDGSWGWGPGFPGTGSMTSAGIASVLAASQRFAGRDATFAGEAIECCGLQEPNPHVDRGLSWLGRHFSVNRNPGTKFWHSYYLFSLERVGRITGQRFIGEHDWYREGVQTLVAMQLPTGAWPSDMDEEHIADPLVATSFSLMFLAKGRRPLVVGHVQHGDGDDWNRHRQGIANLLTQVEKRWRLELAYQTVNLQSAMVEDLLQTPVLYLSSGDAPAISADEAKKLRMYVDRGGFIFADQSCGKGEFDMAFRRLMKEIFPEAESRLRPLPPSHPVWRTETAVELDHAPELWGVDVSCRTAVVYCPDDLSCKWELLGSERGHALSATILGQLKAAADVGVNVLAYATNRDVKFKDPLAPSVADDGEQESFERGHIYVANVLHAGGCAAAPGALWTILNLADRELRLPVGVVPREVTLSDPDLFKFALLHFHGRTAFTLTPEERANLRSFVERGGGILADAVCSSAAFTESFRRELALAMPDQALEPIPADDPLVTGSLGGYDVRQTTRRHAVTAGEASSLDGAVVEGPPRLEGVRVDGRWAVIFSPYDLSCALESREPVECEGYVSRDAVRIAMNALIYLLK